MTIVDRWFSKDVDDLGETDKLSACSDGQKYLLEPKNFFIFVQKCAHYEPIIISLS